jgi:hypothetical protein
VPAKSFGYPDFMNLMRTLSIVILLVSAGTAFAQKSDAGGVGDKPQGYDAPVEFGFHLGNLLPNQISGVTEIMGLGGVRAGLRLGPESYAEAGFIAGNGEGVEWKNAHIDIRMDIPVENLVGIAYVGADSVFFQGNGHGNKLIFGGHAGGGIMGHLSGSCWFRGDMKFGFSPGTSLYIGVGLVFRLGAASNS